MQKMRKNYRKPQTLVINLSEEASLLAASGASAKPVVFNATLGDWSDNGNNDVNL